MSVQTVEMVQKKILVVDDDETAGLFYQRIWTRQGFHVDYSKNLSSLRDRLVASVYDAIFLDLELDDEDGLDGLAVILRESPSTRVYILTAHGSVDRAVEAMRKGATGFFEKGRDPSQMVSELTFGYPVQSRSAIDLAKFGLIGTSKPLEDLMIKIDRLRMVDSNVLILGESGSGKEVVARAIHRSSKRGNNRFSAINCSSIPENLLESELFGHKRGAFTDAKADRKGIFELTSSGTLLLDEIGDMPLFMQAKLLRVLQEREITPVGSSQVIPIDSRIIAATHRNIVASMESNLFREDLYYRLSIVVLKVPSLRERADDIPLLVRHFLGIFNRRFERNVQLPSDSDMRRIMAYQWPGNIRELQNAIERAVVFSADDKIDLEDIFTSRVSSVPPSESTNSASSVGTPFLNLTLTDAKQAYEKRYLEHHVKDCQGNVNKLALRTGRYRADIYRLLGRHGIEHNDFRRQDTQSDDEARAEDP